MLETLWHTMLMDLQDSQLNVTMLLTQVTSHLLLNKEQLSNHMTTKVLQLVESNSQIHHYALLLPVNHIKIQIFSEQSKEVKQFKNQQLLLNKPNQDIPKLMLDPMLLVMMTQPLKKKMELCMLLLPGKKAIGKAIFSLSQNLIQLQERSLEELIMEEVDCTEILKDQTPGRRKRALLLQ